MTLRPHNDISGLGPDPEGGAALQAAVVIPVYNRPDLLARTLAGLERSSRPVPVVVADDGSETDIARVVDSAPMDVMLVRQERRGWGAGRARNLGASHAADADVLIFLDADCIPHRDLVSNHLAWHAADDRLVTVGGRAHIRAGDVPPAEIGSIDLETRIEEGFTGKADFRRVLERRSSGLRVGDEAFRTFVSSNVAVRRDMFEAVGGFDERFRRWGGEDTELGWRLWQEGAFFVSTPEALIYHQLDEDEAGGHAGRAESRSLNDGLIASLIPHGFYRKARRDVLYQVPKVSVVAHTLGERLDELWTDVNSQTTPDLELILVGVDDRHEPLAGLLSGDPRVGAAPDLRTGIGLASGELVVTVDASVALDHRFLARVVKHFHDRPSTSSLTVGYTLPSQPIQVFRRGDDAGWIDSRWAGDLPLVTVARRRDWVKARAMEPRTAWPEIRALERPDHLEQGLAWIPSVDRRARPADFVANRPTRAEMLDDLRSEPKQALRTAAKIIRARTQGVPYSIPTAPSPPSAREPEEELVHARYVGWVGYDNLGDEAMLEGVRRLLPWASVEVSGVPRDLLLLGGGTLINRTTYLAWLTERDSPRIERAVLGTGVASPEFWGVTESTEGWVRWLSSCAYLGVRGPHSERTLRSWGYEGDLEVCGDSALLFERPASVERRPGQVVVSPAWTNGELWGGSDQAVMDGLAKAIEGWLAEGREVTFLSCNPSDDRPIFELMRAVGQPGLPYLAGYRDLDASLEMLAGAEMAIGERLHAAVLAAAVGTPFVALEYRPKLADFAASVGAGEAVVRTNEVTPERLAEAMAAAARLAGEVGTHVAEYRERLRMGAERIREAVAG